MLTTIYQENIENSMMKELKNLNVEQVKITEYDRYGNVSSTKIYSQLIYAVRRMINFVNGEFPIYQNSECTSMGRKMSISLQSK